jgi:3-oxoacyl-[acyl-carrier protein] reductase
MDLGLKNKRVVITGASRGIGREISDKFFEEGSKLTLIARNKDQLEKLINSYGGEKNGHNYIAVDLNQKKIPTKVANDIIKTNEKIDVVVHNLGGGIGSSDIFSELENWKDVWMFNVGIAIELNKVFAPHMVEKKWGRIVHISSSNSITGGTMSDGEAPAPAYSCAKAYLNMYSKILSRELAKHNIVVSAVMPGILKVEGKYWDRLEKANPSLIKNYLKNHHAIRRFGKPEEIAPFVIMLASKHASFASGANINIDGGYL